MRRKDGRIVKETNPEKIKESMAHLEDLKELRGGTIIDFHKKIANDPKLIHAFIEQYKNCNKGETVIPRKYRELMIMLLGCARGVQTTIITHSKLAVEYGATVEEVGEALRLAFLICGVSAIIPGAEVFEALE